MTEEKKKPKEEPKEESKVESKKEEVKSVTIPKDTFDRMQKDISMLKETADRKRMALYQHRHKEDQFPMVRLRELDGKVIMGWRLTKNDIHFDLAKKVWVEDQEVELLFEDGKREAVPYKDFANNYRSIECDQIGIIKEAGQVALKLRRKDNLKEYTVGVAYVN